MPGNGTFTDAHSWEASRKLLAFTAEAEGGPVRCLVPFEALVTRFGADASRGPDGAEAERAFLAHREQIRQAARERIQAGAVGPDGTLLILARHIR
jgi:hypothetical protein